MSSFPSPWAASYSPETSLDAIHCIFVDVQATGASPRSGSLLEVSCSLWHPSLNGRETFQESISGFSSLVTLPPGHKIPRRVTKLTGLKHSALKSAPLPEEVAARLWTLMIGIKLDIDQGVPWVWVAHVARYERSFMRALCLAHPPRELNVSDAERLFDDLPWICTHAVSVRLYPALPRRTLSAMNGFFGGELLRYKRSGPHMKATQLIWSALFVQLLTDHCSTWGELGLWVLKPAKRPKFKPPISASKRLDTPSLPGVYRFLDDQSRVIYVGMARNLHQRVNQHFRGQKGHDEHHLELISIARDLSFTTRASVLEAKWLESREIKFYQPKYNRALRDNTAPFYIDMTTGERLTDLDLKPTQEVIGPLIDHYLIESLEVIQSCLRGDYLKIHHRGWPVLELDEWRSQIELLRDLLYSTIDENLSGESKLSLVSSGSLRGWLTLGRSLTYEDRSSSAGECTLVQKAGVFAQRLWRVYKESQWQRLLSVGELVWYADTGGTSGSWRALFTSKQRPNTDHDGESLYSEDRSSIYLSEPPQSQQMLDDPLEQLSSLGGNDIESRVEYDEARLTFLTVLRHLQDGEEVFWRPSTEVDLWYCLRPSRIVAPLAPDERYAEGESHTK